MIMNNERKNAVKNKDILCYSRERLVLLLATWRSSGITLGITMSLASPAKPLWKSNSWDYLGLMLAPGCVDKPAPEGNTSLVCLAGGKVYKAFLCSSQGSMNSRLSVPTVPNLEFSLRPPFSGSQVVLQKGCSVAREPGIPASALCLLQILNSSCFSHFERISGKIPSSRMLAVGTMNGTIGTRNEKNIIARGMGKLVIFCPAAAMTSLFRKNTSGTVDYVDDHHHGLPTGSFVGSLYGMVHEKESDLDSTHLERGLTPKKKAIVTANFHIFTGLLAKTWSAHKHPSMNSVEVVKRCNHMVSDSPSSPSAVRSEGSIMIVAAVGYAWTISLLYPMADFMVERTLRSVQKSKHNPIIQSDNLLPRLCPRRDTCLGLIWLISNGLAVLNGAAHMVANEDCGNESTGLQQ
ncbi:hypothetical protein EK904_005170 [Melospiza melodia maxima]|nr:hypothetical protein EK904_005170 [Melospiza melodia maxima]